MTTTPQPGEVRVSPDGECLAWYQPDGENDTRPWLTLISPGDVDIDTDHQWSHVDDVAGWRVVGHSEPPGGQP